MNYIITALILIAYELQLFFHLKLLFGYKKSQYKKPFDCFFCLSVWANTLLTLIYISINYESMLYNIFSNNNICIVQNWAIAILITKIIDVLWNNRN